MAEPPELGVRLESQSVRTRLREAKWYAFDLDDTLHSFRRASAAAVTAVLRKIHEESNPVCSLGDLEAEYKRILTRGTASAFVDGKTSYQYREDRLHQLVQKHNIELYTGQMQTLLGCYEKVLIESLELRMGVLDLLQTLKNYGHKIAVITEGPQDAQERTVEALGLTQYIDYLATTNKLGVAKVDGLFVKVLEHLGLKPNDVIMIGDSWERDIVPATQAGIYCVYYTEVAAAHDEQMRIERFDMLEAFVEDAHRYSVA